MIDMKAICDCFGQLVLRSLVPKISQNLSESVGLGLASWSIIK